MVKCIFFFDKAAKLLGRTRESCRGQLYRLGLSLGVTKEKKSETVVVVFPQHQIDRRKALLTQTQPRLKKRLNSKPSAVWCNLEKWLMTNLLTSWVTLPLFMLGPLSKGSRGSPRKGPYTRR